MTPPEMEFFKMSGAGNDFVLFDNRAGVLKGERFGDLVRHICTRALSVGADGVVLLEPSTVANVRAAFFNPARSRRWYTLLGSRRSTLSIDTFASAVSRFITTCACCFAAVSGAPARASILATWSW